jgi:glycine cleavage system H protein
MRETTTMASHPDDLRYTEKHHWVRPGEKLVEIGITESAADDLGRIGFVEMPYPGELFKAGALLGRVSGETSSKALFMPFVGQVNAVNQALSDAPGLINSDPYGEGWIVRLEPGALTDVEDLMDAASYEASLTEQDG